MGQEETRAALQARFGAPTIREIEAGQTGGIQATDPQGRLRTFESPEARQAAFDQNQASFDAQSLSRQQGIGGTGSFAGDSAAREQRIADRPDFGAARASQNIPSDVQEALNKPAQQRTPQETQRLAQWEGSTQAQQMRAQGTGPFAQEDRMSLQDQIAIRRQNLAEQKFEYDLVKDAKTTYSEEIESLKKASTEEAKAESVGRGLVRSVGDMREVMHRAASRLDKFMATDMVGKAASFWKGSEADAQEQDFAFLKSNVALNAMMELKRLSPTGSTGFGALNTEELKTLQNQFAALDPFTDSKLVRKNLKQLSDRFDGIIQDAYREHATQYGEEAAKSVYGPMLSGGSGQVGTQTQQSSGSVNVPAVEGVTITRID
jgi:hypothetical protein